MEIDKSYTHLHVRIRELVDKPHAQTSRMLPYHQARWRCSYLMKMKKHTLQRMMIGKDSNDRISSFYWVDFLRRCGWISSQVQMMLLE